MLRLHRRDGLLHNWAWLESSTLLLWLISLFKTLIVMLVQTLALGRTIVLSFSIDDFHALPRIAEGALKEILHIKGFND